MSKLKAFIAGAAAGVLTYGIVSYLTDSDDYSESETDDEALNNEDAGEIANVVAGGNAETQA